LSFDVNIALSEGYVKTKVKTTVFCCLGVVIRSKSEIYEL